MFKFIFLFLLSFNACAFDEWSEADKTREAVYLALHVIDWAQTRNIARSPDKYAENGVFARTMIGAHPSVANVNMYMAGSAILQYAAARALPSEYRKAFQYVTIIDSGSSVIGNFRVGIKVTF